MNRGLIVAAVIALGVVLVWSEPARAASCDSLTALTLADTTIKAATLVPAGPFVAPGRGAAPPAGGRQGAPPPMVPAICRVELTVSPAVNIEVWLPATGWNGKFQGVGGGGYAGIVSYPALVAAVNAGYAAASTDTGHVDGDSAFALGHPELVVDFGYRAIHEMTVKGKAITEAFYGNAAKQAYFVGCSTGGRQALAEAQRYPADYDGLVAGAPAINWAHLLVSSLWTGLATLKDEASYIPVAKLAAANDASLAACDALDGVKDGIVDDPRRCTFDPAVIQCRGDDSPECLTAKQVEALRKIYDGARYANGKPIYPGRLPGTERAWTAFTAGPRPGAGLSHVFGVGYIKNFVFADPNWDFKAWDMATDMPKVDADQKNRSVMDTWNPDLRPFRDRGGRLLLYHGWGDDAISPISTINYFREVAAVTTGGKAADKAGDFVRLFLVPGMGHCNGGPGPTAFDGVGAIARWVENKQAPAQLLGSHLTAGIADLTRPLCPYPMTAQYSGQGSTTDAANFSCKQPR